MAGVAVTAGASGAGTNAVKALEGRAAALIANHGLVAVGTRPDKALHVTALVERTAQIVWGARALGGPVPIPTRSTRTSARSTATCAKTRCRTTPLRERACLHATRRRIPYKRARSRGGQAASMRIFGR